MPISVGYARCVRRKRLSDPRRACDGRPARGRVVGDGSHSSRCRSWSRVSSLPASSVKDTRTLTALPFVSSGQGVGRARSAGNIGVVGHPLVAEGGVGQAVSIGNARCVLRSASRPPAPCRVIVGAPVAGLFSTGPGTVTDGRVRQRPTCLGAYRPGRTAVRRRRQRYDQIPRRRLGRTQMVQLRFSPFTTRAAFLTFPFSTWNASSRSFL